MSSYVERLEALVRKARKLQLGWEIADRFDYEEQSNPALSGPCDEFCRKFHAETKRLLSAAKEGDEV